MIVYNTMYDMFMWQICSLRCQNHDGT